MMNQSGLDCPEVWARRAFSARASSLPAFTSFSNWRSHVSASNATYHRRNAASSSEESFSICCSIASTLLIHHLHFPGSETTSVSLLSISNQNVRILALEKDAVQLPIRSPSPGLGRWGKRNGGLMISPLLAQRAVADSPSLDARSLGQTKPCLLWEVER